MRFRDRLHMVLGFSAGVILGIVAFDVLPEIFALSSREGSDGRGAMVGLVIGFVLFHGLEKFVLVHSVHEEDYAEHRHPRVGVLSALALIGHSFMDGVAIGLAFQASPALGVTVAVAVIAHDFCDGLNTVGLMLLHRNDARRSLAMLAGDALAPVLGAVFATSVVLPPAALPPCLGAFAGFLLYIAAADILPQAHSQAGPRQAMRLIGLTALGAAFAWAVVQLAG